MCERLYTTHGRAKIYPANLSLRLPGYLPDDVYDQGRESAEGGLSVGSEAQWREKPLQGDVELDIALYFGTQRKADWDELS